MLVAAAVIVTAAAFDIRLQESPLVVVSIIAFDLVCQNCDTLCCAREFFLLNIQHLGCVSNHRRVLLHLDFLRQG